MSAFISRKQASNTRPAILLAEKLGTPLNQLVTINFSKLDLDDEDTIATLLERIRARYSRWAQKPGLRRGGKPFRGAFIWVLEKTAHYGAHLLVHVPESRQKQFRTDVEKWIMKDVGSAIMPGVIDIREPYNLFGLRKYMIKGLDPKFCGLYRVNHVFQGELGVKRFGFSQHLGPSACKEHGTKKPYRWPKQAAAISAQAS